MKQHNRYFCHNGTRVKNDTLGDHASQLKTVDTRDGEDARRHGKGQGEKTIEQRGVALLTALLLFPLLDKENFLGENFPRKPKILFLGGVRFFYLSPEIFGPFESPPKPNWCSQISGHPAAS